MQVLVLSGLPGSGKSTYVNHLLAETRERGQMVAVVSADDFFIQPDGAWVFDPTKIGEAHADCLKRFVAYCQDPVAFNANLCIVDNTNLSIAEIAPYMAFAQAYGHEAKVVRIKCPGDVAFARQTHGVPLERFMHMFANQRELVLPPWWPTETIDTTPHPTNP